MEGCRAGWGQTEDVVVPRMLMKTLTEKVVFE